MSAPTDRKYLETHEWHLGNRDVITIGISQFAADELSDITFVDLPDVGDKVEANKPFGEIESVKATADLICGVSGVITAVNSELADNPGLVNKDPYTSAWMIKVKISNHKDLDNLLPADQYLKKIGH